MNTRLVNTAAGVIMAALTQNRTPAGIALALDSAQMLLTPEMTAELARLQDRVAELEEQLQALRGQQETLLAADGITRRIAPTQALLDGEHYASTHHDYRVGRDLPELGGAQ
jgi:folate-dependent tRNA-U54 methylase TrmFO/GidA